MLAVRSAAVDFLGGEAALEVRRHCHAEVKDSVPIAM